MLSSLFSSALREPALAPAASGFCPPPSGGPPRVPETTLLSFPSIQGELQLFLSPSLPCTCMFCEQPRPVGGAVLSNRAAPGEPMAAGPPSSPAGRRPGLLELLAVAVLVLLVFGPGPALGQQVYTNTWAVHIPGGPEEADRIASKHGFINHGHRKFWSRDDPTGGTD
ncbi:unnamed protein product [Menidia menidia]|uniref:(Atlantic silverside) hypothetical protein n=1 Tax=Menidia menidia TaxID=238744 RepID=A0A8S4A6L2_9TELE|nr:unnamed protein product [Menidia menidia]